MDHFRYFFHDPWCGDLNNLLHCALLNALLWDQLHNITNLLHDLRNVLNRHLRLAVWTQPPKIIILTYIRQFLFQTCDFECVKGRNVLSLTTGIPERDILITSANINIITADVDSAC